MPKNVLPPFQAILNGDMSADIVGPATDLMQQDNCAYQAEWSGVGLVGSFIVEATNDNIKDTTITPTWTELIMDMTTAIPADTGDAIFNINQYPGKYIRFRWAWTAGTGTLNVKMTSKEIS